MRSVEARRQSLDGCKRAGRQIGQPQAGRRQEPRDAHECPVAVEVRIDDLNRRVVRQRELASRPLATRLGRVDIQTSLDVVEHADQQVAAGCSCVLEGFTWPGSVDQGRAQVFGRSGCRSEIDRHQRSLPERRSGSFPVFTKAYDEAAFDERNDAGLRRQRQLPRSGRSDEVVFGFEKRKRAPDNEGAVTGAVVEGRRTDGDIAGRSAKHFDGRRQRLSPLDAFDDIGIAGASKLARRPFPGDQQRIAVLPRRVLLAAGEREAAVDKSSRAQVEFAQRDSILATVGQVDHAATLRRLRTIRTAPEPIGLLFLRQGIQVQDGRPRGFGLSIVGETCPPPDSAHVVGVLPAVENLTTEEVRLGDPVLGLGDFQRFGEQNGISGILLQHSRSLGILGPDPRHRPLAVDVFEPDERIFARSAGVGGACRCSTDDNHGARDGN